MPKYLKTSDIYLKTLQRLEGDGSLIKHARDIARELELLRKFWNAVDREDDSEILRLFDLYEEEYIG